MQKRNSKYTASYKPSSLGGKSWNQFGDDLTYCDSDQGYNNIMEAYEGS